MNRQQRRNLFDEPLTARELLGGLQHDPNYLAHLIDLEKHERAAKDRYSAAAAPLLSELTVAGLQLDTVGELIHSEAYRTKEIYTRALPLLLRWLPRIQDRHVKDDIIRTLSVKWAGSDAARVLIDEFRNAGADEELYVKWAIGNALSVIADDQLFDDLVVLLRDKRHGRAREMVAVALANMKDLRAVDVLIELLDDEQLAGHALYALRKLGRRATKARPALERFVAHPKTWVRNEAKRAIAKIDKTPARTKGSPPHGSLKQATDVDRTTGT